MAQMDSFGARRALDLASATVETWSLHAVPAAEHLPFCLNLVLENILRHEDGVTVTA